MILWNIEDKECSLLFQQVVKQRDCHSMQIKQNVWSYPKCHSLLHATSHAIPKSLNKSTGSYLGFTITSDGKYKKEVKEGIALLKDTFTKMSAKFKNRNMSLNTKIKCYIWAALHWGCKCWTISKDLKAHLEMWFFHRILCISWIEKKSNKEVWQAWKGVD